MLLLATLAVLVATPDTRFSATLASDLVTLGDFSVDALGTRAERTAYLDARLRLRGEARVDAWRFVGELDVVDGQVAGALSPVGTVLGVDTFDRRRDRLDGPFAITPRELRVELDTSIGRFSLGQDVPTWGLGMLVNGGWEDAEFGRARGGNVVSRLAFATRPLSGLDAPRLVRDVVVAAAGDFVFRDDQAFVLLGDLAGGASLAVFGTDGDTTLGVLGALRAQRDRSAASDPGGARRTLDVVAVDAFARHQLIGDAKAPVALELGLEGAVTLGHTDRLVLESTAVGGASVQGLGALARAELRVYDWLHARLEAGLASGDDDPYDATVRTFSFNTAHPVGLVLFSQVLPMVTARAADRVASPALRDRAPPGLRSSVNQGTVSAARYLYPTVRLQVAEPLELRLGYLLAGASGAFTDVYRTAEAGGYASAPGGGRAREALLGQEFLVGLRLRVPLDPVTLLAGLDATAFVPGPTLASIGVGTIGLVRTSLQVEL